MNPADTERLAVLWVSAQDDVATFIRSFIRDPERATDVLQQVAVKIVRNFDKYDPARPFSPWAIGVARHEVLTYLRRQTADRHLFDDELVRRLADAVEQRITSEGPYETALRDCVNQVQDRGRRALELYYGQGKKTAQIAQEMSMTPGAVRMLLCRVREAIRKCVQARLAAEGSD